MSHPSITVNTDALRTVLARAAGLDRQNKAYAFNDLIRLQSANGRLEIQAADTSTSLQCKIDATGDDFAVLAPADKMHAAIKACLTDQVKITVGERLVLTSGKATFRMQTTPVGQFPAIAPAPEKAVRATLPANALQEAFEKVFFAAAMNDVRYYLNGVQVVLKDGQLHTAASNGHMAATWAATFEGNCQAQVIVSRSAVKQITKWFGADETLQVAIGEGSLWVSATDIAARFSLLDGAFPDVSKVFVKRAEGVSMAPCEVLHALQCMAVGFDDGSNKALPMLKVDFGPTTVIENTGEGVAQARDEVVPQSCTHQSPITFGMCAEYLLDIVTATKGAQAVHIRYDNDPNASLQIDCPDVPNWKVALMPSRL